MCVLCSETGSLGGNRGHDLIQIKHVDWIQLSDCRSEGRGGPELEVGDGVDSEGRSRALLVHHLQNINFYVGIAHNWHALSEAFEVGASIETVPLQLLHVRLKLRNFTKNLVLDVQHILPQQVQVCLGVEVGVHASLRRHDERVPILMQLQKPGIVGLGLLCLLECSFAAHDNLC